MSEIDIETVRGDTPGCSEVIHLNNAGAALPPRPVLSASIDYLETEARLGGYEAASARAEDLGMVYDAGAMLLGCSPREVAFVSSATHAWSAAVGSVPLEAGDRVLASTAEYVSSAFGLARLGQQGIDVELIPTDDAGRVSTDALTELLDERVKLVCVTHIPTGGGLVNPVADIGKVVAESDARYLVDATQSVGQVPVEVDDVGCDFLVVTGRKFLRGPRGSGLLYARSSTLDGLNPPPMMDSRSARWTDDWSSEMHLGARRFETFEASMAAKVGFGVAMAYALELGIEAIEARVETLAGALRRRLEAAPFVRVDEGSGPQSGIVTFHVEGRSSQAVVAALRAWGINTSVVEVQPKGFDPDLRHNRALIRASVHYYNTEDELDDAVATI